MAYALRKEDQEDWAWSRFYRPEPSIYEVRYRNKIELYYQQNGLCSLCDIQMNDPHEYNQHPEDATLDHSTPLSRGGTDEVSNLSVVCRYCNQLKADMTLEEYWLEMPMYIYRTLLRGDF